MSALWLHQVPNHCDSCDDDDTWPHSVSHSRIPPFVMSALWLHQIYYIFGFLFLVMIVLVRTLLLLLRPHRRSPTPLPHLALSPTPLPRRRWRRAPRSPSCCATSSCATRTTAGGGGPSSPPARARGTPCMLCQISNEASFSLGIVTEPELHKIIDDLFSALEDLQLAILIKRR